MIREYLNARSPLRLLEKGLHGGLGAGNVGVVLAGHGVGKSSFLVGMALDELLREKQVLHVSLDSSVQHVRDYYDTLFEELATSSHLEDSAVVHAEIDRRRRVWVYPADSFDSGKLREAVGIEIEAGGKPELIVVDGIDLGGLAEVNLGDVKALARELDAEVWLGVASGAEKVDSVPQEVTAAGEDISVILALEPNDGAVGLRAIKDHDNPDVSALHVALDPRTLLLVRT